MAKKGQKVKYRTKTKTVYRTRSKSRKSRKGSRRSKVYTVSAGDIAAGGAMFLMLNGDKVAARALAVANKQSTIQDALLGAASDIYGGAKANTVPLMAIPLGLSFARKTLGRGKAVKVPVLPLRIRGL